MGMKKEMLFVMCCIIFFEWTRADDSWTAFFAGINSSGAYNILYADAFSFAIQSCQSWGSQTILLWSRWLKTNGCWRV